MFNWEKTKDPLLIFHFHAAEVQPSFALPSFNIFWPSFSFFWWKGVTVTWHNSLPGVTNVLVDRIVSLPAHHRSGHRPSPKHWRSTTPWQTSTWAWMASARKEQRPWARQRGASGAKVVETWESQEVLGGCWACGSFKKSLKWNGTRLGNFSYLSTWQI